MINYTATYTDLYQLTMAQAYYLKGRQNENAVFDYFFRKLPFNGGYAIFAGLETLLDILEELIFTDNELAYLNQLGFDNDFIEYLKGFRFSGKINSIKEGDIIFPTMPVLQVEAGIIHAQIIETVLLNILNFQSLIATKASRMRIVAGNRNLIDFGLRRAPGPGGYYASRAAFIGGFNATSNVRAGFDFNIPVSGTMAHSFIQSYDNELTAFRNYAEIYPDNCVLLVDTYDTLHSGVLNAVIVGKEMQARGEKLLGIRLDSGDLAYLATESRKLLDKAGLNEVKIAVSNQLDEYVIKSLLDQNAPIDIFGVGTSLVTGSPDAAFDGVYKLAYINNKPRIKLSETIRKVTLPHKKQVYRIIENSGNWIGTDAIVLANEKEFKNITDPFEPVKSMNVENFQKEALLEPVMENGIRKTEKRSVEEISAYSTSRLSKLPVEYKRFENPHIYKIGISDMLKAERDKLIDEWKT